MRFTKKLVGFLLATSLTCGMLVGCTSGTPEIDTEAVVLTANGEEVTLGFADFYARYEQSYMESYYMVYYGDEMWEAEEDGLTYEEEYKDSILTTVSQLIITRQYAVELGLSLTEEETAAIQEVAEELYNDNTEEQRAYASLTVENVVEMLELYIMEEKCRLEVVKGIDTEVTEEESTQKAATYVLFELVTEDEDGNDVAMTDDELATLVLAMEDLLALSEESGDLYATAEEWGYTPVAFTFNVDSTDYDADICAALDVLSEGEFTDIIESESYYSIAQLTSEYDEEATATAVEEILSERETELYTEVLSAYIAEAEVTTDEEAWATVDFINYGVTMYVEPTEETTE